MRSGSRCPAFYGEIPPMRWGILNDDGGYFYCITYTLPHSAKGKGDFSSIITMMETTDGYTKVRRLCSNGQLKITKSNLKQTIHEEIENGYLAA